MQRLAVIFAFLVQLLALSALGFSADSSLALNPVRVYADRESRIHVTYQKECGASFSGFMLRTNEKKVLYVAVTTKRENTRCMDLPGLEELVIPKLLASDFAGVLSLVPSTEPNYLKLSPIQNFNQVKDSDGYRFEASYTSQCATALGLNIFPKANGLEVSIVEGRYGRFENCNRSTKLVSYPHINLSNASLRALSNFAEETAAPRYTLHRGQTRLFAMGDHHKAYYLRRCDEAPIGLVRAQTSKGLEISMLLARYSDVKCPEGAPKMIWTPWAEKLQDKEPIAFEGEKRSLPLLISRPKSYDLTRDTLSVVTSSSCQNDIGIVSRTTSEGYAVGILHIQSSSPCNSALKDVTYSYNWSFDESVKRDVKPLQLVGI